MTLDELRRGRIGLLLSGGGAKGAYQIGCCKALRQFGVHRFSAIAGSSVGAMNAMLIASDRLDTAERLWTRLRYRDIAGLTFGRILLLPLWILAALGSEFSPLKLTRWADTIAHDHPIVRWLHPALCCAAGAAVWGLRGAAGATALPYWTTLAVLLMACGALTALHRVLRRIFLSPVLTTNAALAGIVNDLWTDDDVCRLGAQPPPIYGVVSRFSPHRRSVPWGGWVPHYVRLDTLDAASLRETLLSGSAVPGLFPAGGSDKGWALDGSWTDNVPAAPLLFAHGHELDAIFVIHLKRKIRHTRRHNSLWGLIELLYRDWLGGARPEDNLRSWATTRWGAYCESEHSGRPPAHQPADLGARRASTPPGGPVIVSVSPSRRVGNFFSGTLWFSPSNATALIELGEQDMRRVLAQLGAIPGDSRPERVPSAGPVVDAAISGG